MGDPLSRFPKSGVWCHKHSEAFPAFAASQEEGYAFGIELEIPEGLSEAVRTLPSSRSVLLGVGAAESITHESEKRRLELTREFLDNSLITDLFHAALTIISSEIADREIDARICDFCRTEKGVIICLMGSESDSRVIDEIASKTKDLCDLLCDEVAAELGIPF